MIKLIILLLFSLTFFGTELFGRINNDLILRLSQSPYYISEDLVFSSSSNITIEAGVELLVDEEITITVEGSLLAIGEFGNEILFAPIYDSWGGIKFKNKNPLLLKYCIFRDGGSSANNNSLIYINNSSPSFDYCTFEEYYNDIVLIDRISEPDFGQGFLASEGYNTFINSNENNYINNRSAFKIYANNNCWSQADIDEYIFDNKDIPNFGEVIFEVISEKCPSGNLEKPQFIDTDTTGILSIDDFIEWNKIKLAEDYLLEYSINNFLDSDSIITENNSFTLDPYITNSEISFRVKARAGKKESQYSDILSLTTLDTLLPNQVILDEIKSDNCNINLIWVDDPQSNLYQLQLSPSYDFENVILLDKELNSNSYSFNPNNQLKYYYRVRGINLNGKGDWSETREFIGPETYFIEAYDPIYNNLLKYNTNLIQEKISGTSSTININGTIISETVPNSIKINDENLISSEKINYLSHGNEKISLNVFDLEQNKISVKYEYDQIYNYDYTDLNNDNEFEYILNILENDTKKLILKNSNKVTISEREIDIEANFLEPINDLNSLVISGKNQIGSILSLKYNPFTYELDTLHQEIGDHIDTKIIKYQNETYISLLIDSSLYIYDINDNSLLLSQEINGIELEVLDFNNNNYPDLFVKGDNTKWFEFFGNNVYEIDTLQGSYLYSHDENLDGKTDLIFSDRIIINNFCNKLDSLNNITYNFNYTNDGTTNLELFNLPVQFKEIEIRLENSHNGRLIKTQQNNIKLKNIPSGEYQLSITPINQNNSRHDTRTFTLLTNDQIFIDPRFTYQETDVSSKIFLNTEVNNSYDILGGFYLQQDSLICGGWDFIHNIKNDGLKLFVNSNQLNKNGFNDGEQVRFYFVDQSTKEIKPVAVNDGDEFLFGKDRNINTFSEPKTLTLNLQKGWNWISLPITPFEPNINKIFSGEIVLNDKYEDQRSFKTDAKIGDSYIIKAGIKKTFEIDYTFNTKSISEISPFTWQNISAKYYEEIMNKVLVLRTANEIIDPAITDSLTIPDNESVRIIADKNFSVSIENEDYLDHLVETQSSFVKYSNAFLIAKNKNDDDHIRIEDQLGNVLNEVTFSGQYIYTIPGDDPYSPQIEGVKEGDKLELFFVNSSGNKTKLGVQVYDLIADQYYDELVYSHDGLYQIDIATNIENSTARYFYINSKKIKYSSGELKIYDLLGRTKATLKPVPNEYLNLDLKGFHLIVSPETNTVQKIHF